MTRLVGCLAVFLGISLLAQQPVPTIRTRTTLVPVDVRVVDLNGNPVTDLKKDNFSVEEDGVRQEIGLFETHELTAEPIESANQPGLPPLRADLTPGSRPAMTNRRIFLFCFGRGRLQAPDRGVDAVIEFVKDRLLPQDRVAVMAWNRATDFTTGRSGILATLERFRKGHEQIEFELTESFSSLRAIYGTKEIPPDIQAKIDAVFQGPGTAAARRLPPGQPTDARQQAADTRRGAEALQRAEIDAARLPGSGIDTTFDTADADLVNMSFDEFAATSVRASQEVAGLYAAISYLRHFDGEKHIVFINERGIYLPRLDSDKAIAALANSARVVIDTIHTGGVVTLDPFGRSCSTCPLQVMPDRLARVSSTQAFADQSVRNIADFTGGVSTTSGSSSALLAKIDRSSRFEYLLGYVPTNVAWDGKYRRITVKVNRPGVRVLYRHGYDANPSPAPIDRRDVLTNTRIAAAADSLEPIADLKVSATAEYAKGAGEVVVSITVAVNRVKFTDAEGRHKASLQITTYCGDARQSIVGESWQVVDLNLSDATYQRFMSEGVTHSLRTKVKSEPKFVKVIAYDYAADALGTALVRIPAK